MWLGACLENWLWNFGSTFGAGLNIGLQEGIFSSVPAMATINGMEPDDVLSMDRDEQHFVTLVCILCFCICFGTHFQYLHMTHVSFETIFLGQTQVSVEIAQYGIRPKFRTQQQ